MLKKLCTLKPRCTRDIYITTTKVDLCHTILPTNTNPHSFTYSWRIVQQNNSVPHQTPASLLFLKPRTKDQQTFYACTSILWEINIIYADIILEIEKNKYWAKKIIFRWLVYHEVLLSKLCIFLLNHQKKGNNPEPLIMFWDGIHVIDALSFLIFFVFLAGIEWVSLAIVNHMFRKW